MRLKNIYKVLKEVEPLINYKNAERMEGSSDYVIKGWNEVLLCLEKIQYIELFKDAGKELFDISPIFGQNIENLTITGGQANSFNNWQKKIKDQIDTIINLCESLGYGSNEGSFEIKLPETNDFNDFSSHINDLNKVIQTCPFIRIEDNDITLAKTDIGSTWLEFAIIGAETISILTALGCFVQSALKIKSMYLTCEQQKEAVRGAQLKNNLAEEITSMYKDIIKATASNEIKNLEDNLDISLEPEERTSAEKSLEILGKLMSRGLEVYATLDAPQEAKDVFPNIEQQNLLQDPIQLLSGNSDDN